jgi:hypothetical protein
MGSITARLKTALLLSQRLFVVASHIVRPKNDIRASVDKGNILTNNVGGSGL